LEELEDMNRNLKFLVLSASIGIIITGVSWFAGGTVIYPSGSFQEMRGAIFPMYTSWGFKGHIESQFYYEALLANIVFWSLFGMAISMKIIYGIRRY